MIKVWRPHLTMGLMVLAFNLCLKPAFAQHEKNVIPQPKVSLDLASLKTLIQSNQVKTIDELVPLLPPQMKRNAMYVYSTNALNPQLVKPESPRVILFNEDASLILAFTRNPGAQSIQSGDDQLEIMSVNPTTKSFELRSPPFDGKNIPFATGDSPVNPTMCLKCHGTDPRPIFPSYNAWPGFFGSYAQNGAAVEGSTEFKYIKEYLTKHSKVDRYQYLDTSGFYYKEGASDVAPGYYIRSTGFENSVRFDSTDMSPPTVFDALLQERMNERLARKIYTHPMYAEFRRMIGYLGAPNSMLICGPVRDRMSKAFERLVGSDASKQKLASKLIHKLRDQIALDQRQKAADFARFNTPDPRVDPRGTIDVISENLYHWKNHPFNAMNKPAFEKQLVLIETVFANMGGFSNGDFNTHHLMPTIGTFHPYVGNLYQDEQFFQGVAERLAQMDPELQKIYAEGYCGRFGRGAWSDFEKLIVPTTTRSGLLFR